MFGKKKKELQSEKKLELTVSKATHRELIPYENIEPMAKHFAQSGLFKGVKEMSQAVVKITAGRELGLSPFAAMQGIFFIEKEGGGGALQIGYVALLALLHQHGIQYEYLHKTNTVCEMRFTYHGKAVIEKFTIEQAKPLMPKGDKLYYSPWFKCPENMLVARTVSNTAKFHYPFIFNGISIYTEADDFNDKPQTSQPDILMLAPPVAVKIVPTPMQEGISEVKPIGSWSKPERMIALENEISRILGSDAKLLSIKHPGLYDVYKTSLSSSRVSNDWKHSLDVLSELHAKAIEIALELESTENQSAHAKG